MNPEMFLKNVPWWVFPLLAFLIWRGWQASKARTIALPAMFVGPAIFIGWGIATLVTRAVAAPGLALMWCGAAAAGLLIALTTVRIAVKADREARVIRLPGSWWPLTRYLAVFCAKFAIAALSAVQPALRQDLAYADVGVSGLSAGYFVGWLFCVWKTYLHAPPIGSADNVG